MWDKLGCLDWFWKFLCKGLSPDHVAVSVSSDFPSNSQWHALIAYDYSHADWDGLSSHLRDELLMSEVTLYSSEYKVQLSQASTSWKRVLEAAKLA